MNKFIIVGTQRTGSSALGQALGLHPQVACGWEWTQRVGYLSLISLPKKALEGEFSYLPEKHKLYMKKVFTEETCWIGFRRLFRSSDMWIGSPKLAPSLYLERLRDHLDWISADKDIHVIHIVRNDNLSWLKSKALSEKTGSYFGEDYSEVKVSINPKEAVKRLQLKEIIDEKLFSLESTNPYFQVSYESFKKGNRGVVEDVLKFLKLDPVLLPDLKAGMSLKPQTNKTVSSSIENLEEIKSAISLHGYL